MQGDNLGFNHTNGCHPHPQSLDDHGRRGIQRASDLLVSVSACTDERRERILDLAFAASQELRIMAQEGEPLWLFNFEEGIEVLNAVEYRRRFEIHDPTLEEILELIKGETSVLPNPTNQPDNGSTPSMKNDNNFEASRATGIVFSNPTDLVDMFMDVRKWSATFSNIISKARNLALLSEGNQASPNGTLKVMVAGLHIASPMIKTREMYFSRYSRQIDINTWVVADVSLETIFPSPATTCQRKPSGCMIQALQDGLSSVTWVEHNTDCNGVDNGMLKELVGSGCVFTAKRWMSSLERQYDRIATLEGKNDSLNYISANVEGIEAAKNGLLKMAGRMVRHFNFNMFSDVGCVWRPLPIPGAEEEILIKNSYNLDDPEIPHGVAVTLATSIRLPAKQNDVFNFLRTEGNRNKWDILSDGLQIQESVCISSTRNSIDSVSVVSVKPSSTKTSVAYLTESFSDSIVDYLVYAPIDIPTMQHILQGGSTDQVAILASGFAMLPGGSPTGTENSILTIGFQIMDEQIPSPKEMHPEYVLTAYRLMKETISRIQTALIPKSRNT